MTLSDKKELIKLIEQVIDEKITYTELMRHLPKDFDSDDDITTLLDMIEHWPGKTTIWGRDNMSEYKEHEKMTRDYLSKVLSSF